MKKRTRNIIVYSLLSFEIISCAFTIASTLATFTEAKSIDTSATPFMDETSNELLCYPILGDASSVAVGWGKKPTEATGAYTIPSSVTSGGNTYTVKAVVKSGFRYCDFTSVTFAGETVEEIQAEAFYSCQNLVTFDYPKKCITGVAPSCFMDCRKLEKINMNATTAYVLENKDVSGFLTNNRFVVGDHAFSSCVKLKGFTFPINLKEIGDSAFSYCTGIAGIFLPDDNGVTHDITIDKYAFADCSNLAIMHFTTNVSYIDSYAFCKCDKLKIYYGGNNPATDNTDPMASFDEYFRKKHVATNQTNLSTNYVPIEYQVSDMAMDPDHPGLIYTIQPGPIIYDGADNSTVVLDSSTDEYATIFQWQTPTVESDDYDAEHDILTIPNEIDGYPVKRILKQAFSNTYNQTAEEGYKPLKGVVFNAALVQIQRESFKGCSQLATIDFSNCVALLEIGNNAFEVANGTENTVCTSLTIPNCVKYIGKAAFKNFTKVQSFTLFNESETASLGIIGTEAFYQLGYRVASSYKGKLDLVLPRTICDGEMFRCKPIGAPEHNRCIGNKAFMNCPLIKTVTAQACLSNPTRTNGSKAQVEVVTNPYMSFGDQCFSGCTYLLSFKANKAMFWLGSAMFEKCSKLKELFISAYSCQNIGNKKDYDLFLWGHGEGNSIFFNTINGDANASEFKDVVIYVDSPKGPARRARQEKYFVWNSDPKTYVDEYAMSANTNVYAPWLNRKNANSTFTRDSVIGRSIVPTYYNVDYHTAGTIKYVNADNGTVSNTPDYSNSVAFILNGSTYMATKCYASGRSKIDMSGWTIDSKNIGAIGPSSFATLNAGNTASKIVLPNTVTTIRERAFYSVGEDGIDMITFKSGGTEQTIPGSPSVTKYCYLPTSVTRLEGFSFFNNDFTSVLLPNTLTYLGNTAFNISKSKTAAISAFSVTSGGSSPYSMTSDGLGIYDTSTGVLLYHASSGTGTLDLSGDSLTAIGARALANTNYSSIKLPSTLTTVYGSAFNSNRSLTSITNFSGLTYISAQPTVRTDDVWNYDLNFDVADQSARDARYDARKGVVDHYPNPIGYADYYYGNANTNYANRVDYFDWYAKFGAFANCTNLTTFNFDTCTSTLKKIGYGAFEGCTSLSNMTSGTVTYNYYHYYDGLTDSTPINDSSANKESVTSGVLDLSEATNLTSIGRGAFNNCTAIKYAHMPLLYGSDVDANNQASLYFGFDYDEQASWYVLRNSPASGENKAIFDGAAANTSGAVLIGETAQFANGLGSNYKSTTIHNRDNSVVFNVDEWDYSDYTYSRYPNYAFAPSNTYYYVRSKSDALTDTISSVGGKIVKYWIELDGDATNKNYLLFDSVENLKAYYGI